MIRPSTFIKSERMGRPKMWENPKLVIEPIYANELN